MSMQYYKNKTDIYLKCEPFSYPVNCADVAKILARLTLLLMEPTPVPPTSSTQSGGGWWSTSGAKQTTWWPLPDPTQDIKHDQKWW